MPEALSGGMDGDGRVLIVYHRHLAGCCVETLEAEPLAASAKDDWETTCRRCGTMLRFRAGAWERNDRG